MSKNYIGKDLFGYPYNMKYPPNPTQYGDKYGGYPTDRHQVLFHDFAVQGYDLQYKYKGQTFYCLSEKDYVAACDSSFRKESQVFENANQYIEQFEIDGHKLIDIIDELEEVEPM